LTSPEDFGVKLLGNMKDVKFNPDDFKKVILEIGHEIIALEKYNPPIF
jgi:hypothetical protein